MELFLRLLKYLKPYISKLSIAIVALIIYAFFSSVTIWMIGPLFDLIFYPEKVIKVDVSSTASELPLSEYEFTDSIKEKMGNFVNELIIKDTQTESLLSICIAILIIFLIKNIAYYVNLYLTSIIEQGVIRDIRNQLYEHMASLSMDYFNKTRVGTLISRVTNDVQVVNTAIAASFLNLIKDPLLLAFYLFIVLIISWELTIVALFVSLTTVFIVNRIGKRLRKQALLAQKKMANITAVIQETISGMRVVKAFAMEKYETDKFKRESKDYHDTMKKVMVSRKLASPISEFLGVLAITIVLWFGGKQVIVDHSLEANDFMVYLFALFSMMQPLKALGGHYTRIQEGLSAGERIFEVIDTVPMVMNQKNPTAVKKISKSIEFRNVAFDYGDGVILKDINLNLKAGEVVALVGPSGAGKSTLASLIPRFYDPSSGSIFLDGVNLRELDLEGLRKLTGYVTQEVILFNDSIQNNISYGRKDDNPEDIIKSAKTAHAHEFISELPEGYETVIGDRGTRLSGGQQQRVAIARAILNDPPILIFDEATSSLDTESEQKVQEAIEELMKNRTVLVIAHRLSTVKKADRIIVLDKGMIVQEGTHEELISIEGLYSKLYNLQFSL